MGSEEFIAIGWWSNQRKTVTKYLTLNDIFCSWLLSLRLVLN